MISNQPVYQLTRLMEEVQYRQELHDRIFHSDIYTLTKHHRLQHLTLHQCKYSSRIHAMFGSMYSVSDAGEGVINDSLINYSPDMKKVCIDAIIIALSAANVCNQFFSAGVEANESDKPYGPHDVLNDILGSVGQMAKTVEDIDHLMQVQPLREIYRSSSILAARYGSILGHGFDMSWELIMAACLERLLEVEKKNVHFDKHIVEINRLMAPEKSAARSRVIY